MLACICDQKPLFGGKPPTKELGGGGGKTKACLERKLVDAFQNIIEIQLEAQILGIHF